MKNNYTILHPYYLLKKNYNALFYRTHIDFILSLLKFIIKKKTFFLMQRVLFFEFLIKYFQEYNEQQYYKKESYHFFLNIINTIKCIQKQKNYNLYSYVISLIGTMLYFGCYNIGILSINDYNEIEKKNITVLLEKLLEKYKYNPKIIFINK